MRERSSSARTKRCSSVSLRVRLKIKEVFKCKKSLIMWDHCIQTFNDKSEEKLREARREGERVKQTENMIGVVDV